MTLRGRAGPGTYTSAHGGLVLPARFSAAHRCTHALRRWIACGYSLPGNCAPRPEARYSPYVMQTHGRMGSWPEPIAYAMRAAWCGPRNARDELLCGRVVLTTVRRSLHGGPLIARADTMRAVPAARHQGHPQRQNRLLLRGSVRYGEHQGHDSASRRVDHGVADAGHRRSRAPAVTPSPHLEGVT
jgi:hypothetical protein